MREVKDRVAYCSVCNNITDADPCFYCTNPSRDQRLICVVEEPENVSAVEKTRDFKGVYHVLMGALSPLHGIGPDDLKIKGLLGARRRRRDRRSDPGDEPERRRRGDRDLSRQAAQATGRARHAHRDGRPGRQRSRVCRRGHDAQGDGGQKGSVRPIDRFMPGLAALRGYNRAWLGRDVIAGISVAAVAVPIAIAYSQLAGVPPVHGLYASILPLVAYAFFGYVTPTHHGP